MSQRVKAVYQNGTFIPQAPCDLPEGSEVELIIHEPHIIPPLTTSDEERQRILNEVVQNMRDNPLPDDAPRFTREELHERR